MAQFRYFSIPQGAKIMFSATVREADIPKDATGQFIIPLHELQPVDLNAPEKPKQTGIAVFGGKQSPDERAAKFQVHKLLEAGFLPNNIFLVASAKQQGEYSLRVWLDRNEESSGKSFADRGDAGKFALAAISVKRGFVMVYDNGDMWSFNMSGRVLDDRHSTYFSLVPKVIGHVAEESKTPIARVAPVASKPVQQRLAVALLTKSVQPTAMELALQNAILDTRGDELSPLELAHEASHAADYVSGEVEREVLDATGDDCSAIMKKVDDFIENDIRNWSQFLREHDRDRPF